MSFVKNNALPVIVNLATVVGYSSIYKVPKNYRSILYFFALLHAVRPKATDKIFKNRAVKIASYVIPIAIMILLGKRVGKLSWTKSLFHNGFLGTVQIGIPHLLKTRYSDGEEKVPLEEIGASKKVLYDVLQLDSFKPYEITLGKSCLSFTKPAAQELTYSQVDKEITALTRRYFNEFSEKNKDRLLLSRVVRLSCEKGAPIFYGKDGLQRSFMQNFRNVIHLISKENGSKQRELVEELTGGMKDCQMEQARTVQRMLQEMVSKNTGLKGYILNELEKLKLFCLQQTFHRLHQNIMGENNTQNIPAYQDQHMRNRYLYEFNKRGVQIRGYEAAKADAVIFGGGSSHIPFRKKKNSPFDERGVAVFKKIVKQQIPAFCHRIAQELNQQNAADKDAWVKVTTFKKFTILSVPDRSSFGWYNPAKAQLYKKEGLKVSQEQLDINKYCFTGSDILLILREYNIVN